MKISLTLAVGSNRHRMLKLMPPHGLQIHSRVYSEKQSGKQNIKQTREMNGGGVWESNPPQTLFTPANGVEGLLLADRLIRDFILSRRDGLSLKTIKFYNGYLNLSKSVIGIGFTWRDIKTFIDTRKCTPGGKRAYFCALRAFYRWLYSPRSDLGLDPRDNPSLFVDPPKMEKKILPSLSIEEVNYVIDQTECIRDRAIVSLFADSGLRLTELANIKLEDINWDRRLIKVRCKGNKEGYAVFGERTESYLKEWISQRWLDDEYLWDVKRWGISHIMTDLKTKTGLPCNAHTFRRTFASILAKRGVDSLHIMRLGRWECIAMVEHYTRSVKFEDSLTFYQSVL